MEAHACPSCPLSPGAGRDPKWPTAESPGGRRAIHAGCNQVRRSRLSRGELHALRKQLMRDLGL
jgi:hypothetical protein